MHLELRTLEVPGRAKQSSHHLVAYYAHSSLIMDSAERYVRGNFSVEPLLRLCRSDLDASQDSFGLGGISGNLRGVLNKLFPRPCLHGFQREREKKRNILGQVPSDSSLDSCLRVQTLCCEPRPNSCRESHPNSLLIPRLPGRASDHPRSKGMTTPVSSRLLRLHSLHATGDQPTLHQSSIPPWQGPSPWRVSPVASKCLARFCMCFALVLIPLRCARGTGRGWRISSFSFFGGGVGSYFVGRCSQRARGAGEERRVGWGLW